MEPNARRQLKQVFLNVTFLLTVLTVAYNVHGYTQ